MKTPRSQRFRTPPGAPKPKSAVAAKPTRKIAHLVRIELVRDEEHPQGWPREKNLKVPTESCTLRAYLSDGRTFDEVATVTYEPGERERVMESIFKPVHSEVDNMQRFQQVGAFRALIDRRQHAVEEARGRLQQRFGNGVPWQAPKRARKAAA